MVKLVKMKNLKLKQKKNLFYLSQKMVSAKELYIMILELLVEEEKELLEL